MVRGWGFGGVLATVVATLALLTMPASAAPGEVECRPVSLQVPVTLTPVAPLNLPVPGQDWTISGELCTPPGAQRVQLLLHGALFDSRYWDDRSLPQRYNYVRYANEHGWATLNIDRLGNGQSSKPAPQLVTGGVQVKIAHRLVQGLRDGRFGEEFSTVALVGHSYGSGIAAAEAATYRDVDAAVLTGFTHDVVPGPVFPFSTSLAPAAVVAPDRLADRRAPGYFTTRGETLRMFYHRGNYDEDVFARDNANRQTITDAEIATFGNLEAKTPAITAPVLSIIGNKDTIFCGQIECSSALSGTRIEQAFYPSAESFRFETVPGTGHALNHHRSAQETFATIHDWLDRQS